MQGQPISMVDFVEENLLSDLSFEYSCFWFQPILRDAFEKDPSMSLEEARQVITKCLQVLFYRDARSLNKYEIAVITSDGVVIEPATSAQTNWEIAPMVKGYE